MANEGIIKLGDISQIGIAVQDADKIIQAWSLAFGFNNWRYQDMGGIDAKGRSWKAKLCFYKLGPIDLELIQPVEGRIAQSRQLETRGDGVHHIAFPVANVLETAAQFEGRPGFRIVLKTERFTYIEIPGGVTIELVPLHR
jgi:catechol 2,3-dioxygenase-like lactoylglutathione lyase family enzyme